MTTRVFSRWIVAMCIGIIVVTAGRAGAEGNKACGLLMPSEIESVLGAKVTLKSDGQMGEGKTEHCTGQAPAAAVMLRLSTGLDAGGNRPGGKEMKGIETAKQMGAQVEVKTFGAITCSTITPPANIAQMGFNTTCTVKKATALAGVEVQVKSQKDMISIERLRPLAEKMAERF